MVHVFSSHPHPADAKPLSTQSLASKVTTASEFPCLAALNSLRLAAMTAASSSLMRTSSRERSKAIPSCSFGRGADLKFPVIFANNDFFFFLITPIIETLAYAALLIISPFSAIWTTLLRSCARADRSPPDNTAFAYVLSYNSLPCAASVAKSTPLCCSIVWVYAK